MVNKIKNLIFYILVISIITNADQNWLPDNVITPRDNFIKYSITSDTTYKITWGNNKFSRDMDDRAFGAPAWVPFFKHENDSVLILEHGCGSPCWYGIILPLNTTSDIQIIQFPLVYDINRSLIVYIGGYDTLICIENLLTKTTRHVLFEGCTSAFNGYCIDTVWIDDKQVNVKYHNDADKLMKSEVLPKLKVFTLK